MNCPVETPLPSVGSSESASRSHRIGTILPSASRAAATYTTDAIDNPMYQGVRLFFDLTAVGAAGTVTATVQVQDPASGGWMTLAGAVTAALAANALTSLTIYPGATVANNVSISTHLGRKWRLSVVVAANAVVFSVGGEYLACQ